MSAQLQNLDGSPLTWPELHERVRRYWETHERDGELKIELPEPASYRCASRAHSRCKGWRTGGRCGCSCHL